MGGVVITGVSARIRRATTHISPALTAVVCGTKTYKEINQKLERIERKIREIEKKTVDKKYIEIH